MIRKRARNLLRVGVRGDGAAGVVGCLLVAAIFGSYFVVAGCAFDYDLFAIFGRDIPWYADVVAGAILGEVAIPAAIVVWILKLCGLAVPFIGALR